MSNLFDTIKPHYLTACLRPYEAPKGAIRPIWLQGIPSMKFEAKDNQTILGWGRLQAAFALLGDPRAS